MYAAYETPSHVADEVAEAEAEREEVEERLEEAAEDRQPLAAVHHQVPLEEQLPAGVQEPARERQPPRDRVRGHVTSLFVNVRCASQSPAATQAARYATCPREGHSVAVPERQVAQQVDAVPRRRRPGQLAQPLRQPRDREERPREEEHRRDAEAEERVEALVPLQPRGHRRDRGGEGEAEQDRGREGEHREPGVDRAEGGHHGEVEARRERDAARRVELVAERRRRGCGAAPRASRGTGASSGSRPSPDTRTRTRRPASRSRRGSPARRSPGTARRARGRG